VFEGGGGEVSVNFNSSFVNLLNILVHQLAQPTEFYTEYRNYFYFSPGPFGQGELCQANGTPCCSAGSSSSTCTAPQDCACEVTMSPLSERIFADGVCQSV
jgi:hypothetical protein